jgi:predicted regulator of Ras-like GTPase activity (Roadblock/LC7/MglB family)
MATFEQVIGEERMDDQLLGMLEYRGVLSALATTPDGLVIAAAGLTGDDAEILGAAGAMMFNSIADKDVDGGSVEVGSGAVHLMADSDIWLVVLTEVDVPHNLLVDMMRDSLENVSEVLA